MTLTRERVQELRDSVYKYRDSQSDYDTALVSALDGWLATWDAFAGCANPKCVQPLCSVRRTLTGGKP